MSRMATIELFGELRFSAGHFMVFSDAKRETLHGHDYQVDVKFHCAIEHNGMSFDCRDYKRYLQELCQQLDYHFILPSQSEYLRIEDTGTHWIAHVCNMSIPFLKEDAVVLDICNVTLEELSHWFLQQLMRDPADIKANKILGISVRVTNGRGQAGTTSWEETSVTQSNKLITTNVVVA